MQVDEIHDDDTSQIPQTQLACDLMRRSEVHLHHRLFLVFVRLGTVTRVDIYDVHRLRVLENQVRAPFQRHVLGEQRFDLSRYVEIVENRQFALVELHELLALGLDHVHVLAHLLVRRLVIHHDL